ncbi:MAG: AbiH family protein [Putridiphycobacter sp.]|nr:AbiH family protein [Putridiphycobacter sp.]
MANLIIVGNGFDLAHELETKYSDFLKYLLKTEYENPDSMANLFFIHGSIRAKYSTFDNFYREFDYNEISTENQFFRLVLSNSRDALWSDIEFLYSRELMKIAKPQAENQIRKLNNEFETIKIKLQNYLAIEEKAFSAINMYRDFFRILDSDNTIILNFNYTATVSNYFSNEGWKAKVLHVHGRLNDDSNPIIFGYAADHNESRELLDLNESEFLRNIKKHCYKRKDFEPYLKNYMDFQESFDVFILGHSCGNSDKLILNDILNHDKLSKIRISYFNNYENYRVAAVNLDRIMNNDANFKKLVCFDDSLKMPQKSDSCNDTVTDYLQKLVDYQKEARDNKQVKIY